MGEVSVRKQNEGELGYLWDSLGQLQQGGCGVDCGGDLMRSHGVCAIAATSADSVATIAAIANDIVSQQWQ